MIKIRSLAQHTALGLSILCLGVGYIGAGLWQITPAVLLLLIYRWISKGSYPLASRSGVLVAVAAIGANGILMGISPMFMAAAVMAALAWWELVDFQDNLASASAGGSRPGQATQHLLSVGLVTVVSLALIALAAAPELHLSFGLISLLALSAIGGLLFGIRTIKRTEL